MSIGLKTVAIITTLPTLLELIFWAWAGGKPKI